MQFSKNFPNQLTSQILASEVIGKRTGLKKKGNQYSGLCPFHQEKTPSFKVDDNKGFYHCFGCGSHGNIINFIMQIDGLDFKEAVVRLANDYSIQIPIIVNENIEQQQAIKKQRELLLLEVTCQFFSDNLYTNSGNEALQYLYKRGLNKQNIRKFRLGFANNNYNSLTNYLKSHHFTDQELLDSGVIGVGSNQKLYDKFRQRIIFPISNQQNEIIAFGGRILKDEQPKYLNSSETNLFKKSHNLYNLFNAKQAIYKNKFAVIVEGYMDAIALSAKGIENVVAPLGTAITAEQLKMLFKITSDVVVCLDGDLAGVEASKRTANIALPIIKPENLIRFASLPINLDPDDFIKIHGKDSLLNLLQNAENLSKALFNFEVKDLAIDPSLLVSPEKKSQLELKLLQKVNLISDQNSKKYFLQYYKNLLFELGRKKTFLARNAPITSLIVSEDLDKQDIYSLSILAILVKFPQLKDYQDEFCVLRELEFKNQEISNLKEHLINFFDQHNQLDSDEIRLELLKLTNNNILKNKILNTNIGNSLPEAQSRLEIFLLQYFYQEVMDQYLEIISISGEIEADKFSLKTDKQKELYNYKTILEKRILQLTEPYTY